MRLCDDLRLVPMKAGGLGCRSGRCGVSSKQVCLALSYTNTSAEPWVPRRMSVGNTGFGLSVPDLSGTTYLRFLCTCRYTQRECLNSMTEVVHDPACIC